MLKLSAIVTSKNAQLGIAVPDGTFSGYLDDQVRTRTLGDIDKDTDFATQTWSGGQFSIQRLQLERIISTTAISKENIHLP